MQDGVGYHPLEEIFHNTYHDNVEEVIFPSHKILGVDKCVITLERSFFHPLKLFMPKINIYLLESFQ